MLYNVYTMQLHGTRWNMKLRSLNSMSNLYLFCNICDLSNLRGWDIIGSMALCSADVGEYNFQ